jgi:hypothetical protein
VNCVRFFAAPTASALVPAGRSVVTFYEEGRSIHYGDGRVVLYCAGDVHLWLLGHYGVQFPRVVPLAAAAGVAPDVAARRKRREERQTNTMNYLEGMGVALYESGNNLSAFFDPTDLR